MLERYRIWLLVIIWLTAVSLRLTGIDWDGYHHYHPDERYISWVASSIEFFPEGQSIQEALDPIRSAFNPFYWPDEDYAESVVVPLGEPRKFAYGHVPLYLGVIATRFVEQVAPGLLPLFPEDWLFTRDILNGYGYNEFDHLTAVARALTGLIDSFTVLLIYALGRRLYGTAVGLLGATFLALNVMHIQLAHYFAVDPYLAFFVVLALLCMVMGVTTSSDQVRIQRWWLAGAAVALGLAIGSKFSAVMLGLAMALVTMWIGGEQTTTAVIRRWAVYVVLLLIAFTLTNPFAILDNSCTAESDPLFSLSLSSCYLQNIGQQSAMVRGGNAFPFIRQYEGTTSFLYPIEMQMRWGMGWPLGIVAFLGFVIWSGQQAWGLWQNGRNSLSKQHKAAILLLVWCWPYFLSNGSFYVKFMRYMAPLTPFLMLFGAWLIFQLPIWWRRGVTAVVVASTAVYVFAFMQIYSQSHPWTVASEWMYDNVPAESRVVVELWDEPLPSSLDEYNGQSWSRRIFQLRTVNWLSRSGLLDTEEKIRENLAVMAEADVYIVASQRGYGVTPRQPERYPLSSRFYSPLFVGELGYELAFAADRPLGWGGWQTSPDLFTWAEVSPPANLDRFIPLQQRWPSGRVDESFVVYDQPMVMIFINEDRLSEDEMWEQLR